MKINATQTKTNHIEVEVSERDAIECLSASILKKFDLDIDAYLGDDGRIYRSVEEIYGSHSDIQQELRVINPDSDQVSALKTFEELRRLSRIRK